MFLIPQIFWWKEDFYTYACDMFTCLQTQYNLVVQEISRRALFNLLVCVIFWLNWQANGQEELPIAFCLRSHTTVSLKDFLLLVERSGSLFTS